MKTSQKEFIPVMLTPFQDDGRIDYPGLTRLIECYLKAGASGLFANCLSSEMYALDDAERMAVLKHVLKVVDGAVPVVATGAFGGTMEKQAESIRKMYDTGIRAAIVITCLLAGEEESDQVIDRRVFHLLELTGTIPLGFYECPRPYKRVLSARQLGDFVQTGRVIYHKDTCLDINLVREKLAATEGYDFGLYDAYMVHAVESLRAGSRGLSCIQGNYFPELIVWICANFDRPAAAAGVEKVQQFLRKHMDVMHLAYPATAKYFLSRRGIFASSFSRQQEVVFDNAMKRRMDDLFEAYIQLKNDLAL